VPIVVWLFCGFIAGAWLDPSPPALPSLVAPAPASPAPWAETPVTVIAPGATTAPGTSGRNRPPASISPPPRRLPACSFGDRPAAPGPDGDWVFSVVDTRLRLPKGYAPDDLVPVSRAGLAGGGSLRSIAIDDLRALATAAKAADRPLAVQSAYRSETRQGLVFQGWVDRDGEAAARLHSARPGHSEHELGTTLDFRSAGGPAPWTVPFGETATGRWLASHAAAYGFVMSYPDGAESETCYASEPWHFRWVGRGMAVRVAASGLVLRAWLLGGDDRR
jgi:D-alanyl-D-alanine carboxypeptidase